MTNPSQDTVMPPTSTLDEWASQALSTAHALPAKCYASSDLTTLELQAVFQNAWQLVGHASQVTDIGDYLVEQIVNVSVIVIRESETQLRAYHNVCRHRGGPLAYCSGKGAKALRCKYHGWTYGLDGVLRAATEMQSAENFEPSQIKLRELQVGVWEGLIFVGGEHAPAFQEFVAEMQQRAAACSPKSYRFHSTQRYTVACNWKIYVENYLEGYHVPHIHPELNKLLDYRSYITETRPWYSFQYSPLESSDALYGSGEALYYFLYPNTMLNLLPNRLQTNRVMPLGVDHCVVEFTYYYPDDESPEAIARRANDHDFSDVVQKEDIDICEAVQKNLQSGSYVAGRINPLRENALHHFQELIRTAYRNAPRATTDKT